MPHAIGDVSSVDKRTHKVHALYSERCLFCILRDEKKKKKEKRKEREKTYNKRVGRMRGRTVITGRNIAWRAKCCENCQLFGNYAVARDGA